MLRGGAALYVAAYHTVGSLTPSGLRFDTRGGSAHLVRQGNPLGLLGFGLYPVLAFFVLSGFVIHFRQARRPEAVTANRLRWAGVYGWRRALRIYPPLVGALLLTAGLDAVGSRSFADWPWPSGSLTDAGNVLVPLRGAASFGNDFPLWSIAYELWFYVAYVPITLAVVPTRMSGPIRMGAVLAGSLVLAVVLVLVLDHAPNLLASPVRDVATLALYLPAWLAGAFLAELHAAGVGLRRRREALAAAGALVLIATFHSGNDLRPAVDLLWGLAICLLVAALTLRSASGAGGLGPASGAGGLGPASGAGGERAPSRAVRWAGSTASWSYSLYLVHLPVILFAQAALGDGARRITNPLVVLAVFWMAVTAGWLFAQVVERPSRWLMARPPAPAAPTDAGPAHG